MFCGILNQTHVANFHSAFGQLCWFSGKCVFDPKVLKRPTQNDPRKGPLFGDMVREVLAFKGSTSIEKSPVDSDKRSF